MTQIITEACHDGDCDGLDEVVRLLPRGRIWNIDREGNYSGLIKALGAVNSATKQAICQVWNEANPCTSVRLFDYWASLYQLPSCVDQTQDNLCDWIGIIYNDECPIGSLGFLNKVVNFVAPNKQIQLDVNSDLYMGRWSSDQFCANQNNIIITAPPECFSFYEFDGDFPHETQDGINACRRYFVSEIECVRHTVFPLGLSIGYQTNPISPDGFDIFNVPDSSVADRPFGPLECNTKCQG